MHARSTPKAFKNSKNLRLNQTEAEARLWQSLRAHRLGNIHFRRQHAIGPYIVDFCAPALNLVIELDGSQHLELQEYDTERSAYLATRGYRVLRFWNHQVMEQRDEVLTVILGAAQ
jgi:very-short-patch-repair endonuclease